MGLPVAELVAHASVVEAFPSYSRGFEGGLPYMYLDVECLVTTGIGDLADPLPLALAMPWIDPDGSPTSHDDVVGAFNAVKARKDLAQCGGAHFEHVTTIRLTDEGIATVARRTMWTDEQHLLRRFPAFATWPADAQMGLYSWAWAVGPESPYPHMSAALRAGDFATAAAECWIGPKLIGVWVASHREYHPAPPGTPVEQLSPDPKNPGVHPRNLANVRLFLNAARAVEIGADPEVLFYPGSPDDESGGRASTEPAPPDAG